MLVTLLTTFLLVVLSVGVHYNALTMLSAFLRRRSIHVRRWVAASVLGMLIAHIIEVSLFAAGYWILGGSGKYGKLIGEFQGDVNDFWYFSFVAFTSLGFGDITPTHSLRLMTAIETLTGLILIAWSASFIFMQMQRYWDRDELGG